MARKQRRAAASAADGTARTGAIAKLTAGNGRLDRTAWIDAARKQFIRSGYAAIKVDRLAKALKVTRGSFYWHFKDRADLLDAILADWEGANSAAILAAIAQRKSPIDRLFDVGRVWIEEKQYSPAYDSAMRDWARVSPRIKTAVRRVDDARVSALTSLFEDAGYPADEAFIRARITYFHQVGYYAMGVLEARKTRDRFLGLYMSILMGLVS